MPATLVTHCKPSITTQSNTGPDDFAFPDDNNSLTHGALWVRLHVPLCFYAVIAWPTLQQNNEIKVYQNHDECCVNGVE